MRRLVLAGALFLPLVYAGIEPVSTEEARQWIRHTLPLPHEIAIPEKIVVRPGDVGIRLTGDAGDTGVQAVAELRELFEQKTHAKPEGKSFEIVFGLTKSGRLTNLPNRDQAYVIEPQGGKRLVVSALDGTGLYYAARTLCQLLEARFSAGQVVIPLVHVVDWPDMEERGIWNFPQVYEQIPTMPAEWIPWLASIKLNYGEMPHTKMQPIERGKRNGIDIDRELYAAAHSKSFRYVPPITHFNFLHDLGLFRAYPEMAGKGEQSMAGRYTAHKQGNQHRVPFAGHPLFQQILTEWMTDVAAKGVPEVLCWLSERPAEDQRLETTEVGQAVLEARACVAAWREVRKTYPRFGVRLFLSTTADGRYYRVLAEAPPEVKIERACATELERVVHLPRDLLRNPLLDEYAREGRWIGSYDVPITANDRVETPEFMVPESCPHRIKSYVSQLAERKYRGAAGMMAWSNKGKETCGFNIHALAEWTWNLRGRSEKEFSIAWATREGYDDPGQVGEWADLMGPIEFDVYDSDFPTAYSWGKFTEMVRQRQRPYLGEGVFRYYTSKMEFDHKLARCQKALAIARTFKDPYLANETRVVHSYAQLARSIYWIAEQIATEDLSTLERQAILSNRLRELENAGKENVAAIRAWRTAVGPEPWHPRVADAMKATGTTVRDIVDAVSNRYLY